MWKSIMKDLKNSTLGERVLLGVIAGLFALVGFYVGYEHLSNGVNPWLIGGITAFIVMIGCMAAAFILEELIRKIPVRKKYEAERTEPLFDAGSKLPAGEEFEDKKEKAARKAVKAQEATSERTESPTEEAEKKPSFAKRMTLAPSLKTQRIQKEAEEAKKAEATTPVETTKTSVTPVVKTKAVTPEATPSASSEWDLDEELVVKPVAPIKPVAPKAPETKKHVKEEYTEPLSLVDFIKAHPELSARKMVKEYRLAGGTDSTDDILNLMN
jgi:hypothetical protein